MTSPEPPVGWGSADRSPHVEEEHRLRTLERDLGRLEGIVESMAASMKMEHEMARISRADDRQTIKELGEKMERAVTDLASEVKKIAQESAQQDAVIHVKQASTDGAWGLSRWIFATALTIAMLATSWLGSRAGSGRLQDAVEPLCPRSAAPESRPKT